MRPGRGALARNRLEHSNNFPVCLDAAGKPTIALFSLTDMALARGTKLGPYQIESPIGAGGMGEVYKATDTRLERTVAIKVLPAHVASDPERKQRFEREAKTVAALSHPHICPVFDVGREGEIDFLVMEYLEGETLADRLGKGALPLDQALRYAIEIADALDKAHRQGVTHRDLKPANIMLTKAGAKLLDFGLAKLKPTGPQSDASTRLDESLTQQGTILGTFRYMAPEQLEGKNADARTDIWAFGCVVYEMVTGQKAFEGTSQASLIAAILNTDPPASSTLQPVTAPALDRVVKKCLAKDLDSRWQTASDLADELIWIAEGNAEAPTGAPIAAEGWSSNRLAAALLGGCIVGALLTSFVYLAFEVPEAPKEVTRFRISATMSSGDREAGSFPRRNLALSPDGRSLVYGQDQRLYLRALDELDATAIRGTEGATQPFFSPDGQWIGFVQSGQLKKLSIAGGAPIPLGDATGLQGATWSADDTVLFGQESVGIVRMPGSGGAAEVVIPLDEVRGEQALRPQLLPGGRAILFSLSVGDSWDDTSIVVQSIESGERYELVQGGTEAHYVPTGHVVYARAGTLMAVPFDADAREVTGDPVPLGEQVGQISSSWAAVRRDAQFTLSSSGTLLYAPAETVVREGTLVWVDHQGRASPATDTRRAYFLPRISPDGERLAVSIYDEELDRRDVWVLELGRDALTRFTVGDGNSTDAIWTPDGRALTFASDRSRSTYDIFSQPAGGVEDATLVYSQPVPLFPRSWTRDGRSLIFTQFTNSQDLGVLTLGEEGNPNMVLSSRFLEMQPRLSPDGRWLAYASNESGIMNVYVQALLDPERKWQISTDGGAEPLWAPDGQRLFYRNSDMMMVTDVATEPDFLPSRPSVLFEGRYAVDPFGNDARNYDITPDGERFIMIQAGEEESGSPGLTVVRNWFTELERLVPIP